jgi:two-component system, chemotaxis family, chemotaxis protein CheY
MKPITELSKPSLLGNSSLFATVNIAIADSDTRMAQLVKRVLYTLGCQRIFLARDGQEALDLLKNEQVDMLVTDWELKTVNGIELTRFIRLSLDSPNRMLPIIMLTARNDKQDIRIARDAGISEYLIKPFSAKTLMERVHAVVEDPRCFILCKSFVGPDRRRISSLSLPPDPDENHAYKERRPALIVPKEQLQQLILDDTPRMVMPDYTLKKKIGFDIPSELIVNPLTIAKSEEEIKSVQDEFLQSIMKDVESLKDNFQILVNSPDNARKLVKSIQDSADRIKSRAGIFGYIRATEVANQLYNFCRRYYDKNNKNHLIILEKHIQTISVIFAQHVTGDGGTVGADLVRDLAKLIHKYMNRKD